MKRGSNSIRVLSWLILSLPPIQSWMPQGRTHTVAGTWSLVAPRPQSPLVYRSAEPARESTGSLAPRRSPYLRYWPVSVPSGPELISLCEQHMELLAATLPDGIHRALVYTPDPDGLDPGADLLAAYPAEGTRDEGGDGLAWVTGSEGLCVREDGAAVAPLVHEHWLVGWLLVHKTGPPSPSPAVGDVWGEGERSVLSKVASCLALALFMSVRRRRDEEARLRSAEDTLRDAVQQMRSPLSALRTFGKLLKRRLQREGGLNLELAQNIMTQSDRIVELINPFSAVVGMLGNARGEDQGGQGKTALPGGAEDGVALCACGVSDVVEPIFVAAGALAERDGVALACSVEDGLPPVLANARLLQEALAHIIDHSLHYLLWNEEGVVPRPFLRIEALGLFGPSGAVVRVALDVIDNGLGTPAFDVGDFERQGPWEAAKSGLAAAKELAGQMGASVDVASVMGERRVRITLRVAEGQAGEEE